ncbi:3-dehydroquinate synthase [Pseudanabaena sp. PCC 6802]|uniref:3-dehydroquinate synthase n=1 Tax=Pseudanabaena sp. PCC 6802 TaxID=118173 RepID=UPI000346CC0D|nr:3-dehydroquinate synthase [Pseudanabaena sp. PCC 6802]
MSSPATTITVDFSHAKLASRNYEIAIAPQSLPYLGKKMMELEIGKKSKKVLVVSNPVIFKHYGTTVTTSLQSVGYEVADLILPAGERYKNANSLQKIYDAALAHRLERGSTIVALGGGVIGDMAGYAAATWLRGISLVQVPTTLLAMVDSAIGGKTGINHPQGKNLIGAFHQPRLVWVDPDVLRTLPAREFRTAMAEVIKYGVIWDAELFEQMLQSKRLDQLRYIKPDLLFAILSRCARAKAEIVSQDEKEGNIRAILNYGHTIGHAIEAVTNYRLFNHGEAVGLGMIAAGAIAASLNFWTEAERAKQQILIEKAGLPQQLPTDIDLHEIVAALSKDKKVTDGKVQFVVPTTIGKAMVTDQVTADTVSKVLTQNLTP